MTDYPQALALATLQGLTEFLPISSYGHLVLLPHITGWRDHGLAFEVALHLGSLLAVLAYFRADVSQLIRHWFAALRGAPATTHSRLAWCILIATAITAAAGFVFADAIDRMLRAPLPVAFATLGFGLLLGFADWRGRRVRQLHSLGARDALLLGCAQALALIPGISRSGITITAGLLLGLTREAAARMSFLMAIPIIVLASVWQARTLASGEVVVRWDVLLFATAVSAAVAYLCIHWFLAFLQRHSMLPFVIYRVILGAVLLAVFW